MFKEYIDVAISAGGLTSIELAAAKITTLLIATYEHQCERCEYLSKGMFAHYADYYKTLTIIDIINSFRYLIKNINLYKRRY